MSPLLSSEVAEYKIKLKPLYTGVTLLSAIEDAGKEVADAEGKKAVAERGIGTPATRTDITETLILRDYTWGKKKVIAPIEKGLAAYGTVKDRRITSAKMAGSWELILAAIEAGQMPPEKFTQGTSSYVETICEELLALVPQVQKSYPTYCCLKCGNGSVGIYAEVAKCGHEGCDFRIFREVCGTFLSEDNTRDLITAGRMSILKGSTSKAGKKFDARLVPGEDHVISFGFEGKKGKARRR